MNQQVKAIEKTPRLRASALQFSLTPETDLMTGSRTGAQVGDVVSPLETTLILLEDGSTRLCLITTHFGPGLTVNESELFRQSVAADLGIPDNCVLIFSSHNHSCVNFSRNGVRMYETYDVGLPDAELQPIGEQFLNELRSNAARLPDLLEAVTVFWAKGNEDRITYKRKGTRKDGTTYLIREEDRKLLGDDFSGDIDTGAPIVVFKNDADEVVAVLTQFTGHPVTSYHPEKPIVFGDWPQVACEIVANHFNQEKPVPVGFLQGCAGDVNSKEMLSGNIELATKFGRMLGQSYIDALDDLRPSLRDGMNLVIEKVGLPLSPLPEEKLLLAELAEIDDFIQRANAGEEDTLCCVGLNFPVALSPEYRSNLVKLIREWTVWALAQHQLCRAESLPSYLDIEIAVVRIGDIGIVGLPFEPFQEIGRQIRRGVSLPITIPCGYMNSSHGYIPDSGNIDGQEYMSAHYRYTRFRPPLKKPAGDVFAECAVSLLTQLRDDEDR